MMRNKSLTNDHILLYHEWRINVWTVFSEQRAGFNLHKCVSMIDFICNLKTSGTMILLRSTSCQTAATDGFTSLTADNLLRRL